MGPPKKKQFRLGFDEIKRRENYFEYRWNSSEGHYYFFNPYTGETIMNAEQEHIDRNISMFAKPEREQDISKDAYGIVMLPAVFLSRTWGRRSFSGWEGDREGAARCIQAGARGHMARQSIRKYFIDRYCTMLCPFTHYYYFHDHFFPKKDTSWYKPYLATPGLIQPFKPFDPTDNMPNPGDKYSYRGTVKGPYLRQAKIGKLNTERAPQDAFQIVDPRRKIALRTNEEINLEKYPMGTVQFWMDDLRLQTLKINEYQAVRSSIVDNNWDRTLQFMKDNWDNTLVRIYCWHSFSKTEVPAEGKLLLAEATEVLNLAWKCLEDPKWEYGTTEKCFVAAAFHSILSSRASRLEYFNADYVMVHGEQRQAAVDAFVADRCSKFNRYMRFIPTEAVKASVKGSKDFYEERVPIHKHMVLVESILEILAFLGHDSEQKEALAKNTVPEIFYALKVCAENGTLVMAGLRCLYNYIHRCESAQESILIADTINTFKRVRLYHSADVQVMQQLRRLELACKKDGWRGNVETLMEMEMAGRRLPPSKLKDSPFQREYPEWYKFPLEVAEEERLAAIEKDRREQEAIDREEEEQEEAKTRRQSSMGSGRKVGGGGGGGGGGPREDNGSVASGSIAEGDESLEGDGGGLDVVDTDDVMAALSKLRADLSDFRDEHKRGDEHKDKDAGGKFRRGGGGGGGGGGEGKDYQGRDNDDDDDHEEAEVGSVTSLGMDSVHAASKGERIGAGSSPGRERGGGGGRRPVDFKDIGE